MVLLSKPGGNWGRCPVSFKADGMPEVFVGMILGLLCPSDGDEAWLEFGPKPGMPPGGMRPAELLKGIGILPPPGKPPGKVSLGSALWKDEAGAESALESVAKSLRLDPSPLIRSPLSPPVLVGADGIPDCTHTHHTHSLLSTRVITDADECHIPSFG